MPQQHTLHRRPPPPTTDAAASGCPSSTARSFPDRSRFFRAAFAKECNPVVGYWDPLGLADLPLWGQDQDAVIGARRAPLPRRQPVG